MAKGFNRPMMGGGGAGGGMMQQIKKLQDQMEKAQESLAVETTTASVGGGAVKITMTGDQHCKEVIIDPEMLKDADAEMLQDLMLSAINTALDQSRDMANEKLGPLAGGLGGLGL
jgi:DNA-binding YbaB/EbfC family protein